MAKPPVFLERQSYRQRRMMDAIRLLPLLGLGLWMVALLWPVPESSAAGGGPSVPTSAALTYIFGVWMGLVILGWFLWRKTTRFNDPAQERQPE